MGICRLMEKQIMKVDLINSWKKGNKQCDKTCCCLRFGRITLLDISFDISSKYLKLVILNFGVKFNV